MVVYKASEIFGEGVPSEFDTLRDVFHRPALRKALLKLQELQYKGYVMSMAKVDKVVGRLKGKKAKPKKITEEIVGTKESKLNGKTRQGLENAIGADFSRVRIHVGGNVPQICDSLKVNAFTQGNNIYFKKGGDAKNEMLLAHELTHVVQQTGGGKMPKAQKGKVLVSK